jgi:hypothetical protein
VSFLLSLFSRWPTSPTPWPLLFCPWLGGCFGAQSQWRVLFSGILLATALQTAVFSLPCLANQTLASKAEPKQNQAQKEPHRASQIVAMSVVVFGSLGPVHANHSEYWNAWEEAYFPKKSSRGLALGGGGFFRIAFFPKKPFSWELFVGPEILHMKNEDNGNGVKVKATSEAYILREGANVLLPGLSFVRPVVGASLALGYFESELEMGNTTDSQSDFFADYSAQIAARFNTLANMTLEPGLQWSLVEGVQYTVGLGYAF